MVRGGENKVVDFCTTVVIMAENVKVASVKKQLLEKVVNGQINKVDRIFVGLTFVYCDRISASTFRQNKTNLFRIFGI